MTQLKTCVARHGLRTIQATSSVRQEDARGFREWLLLHEPQTRSRSWRKLAARKFDVFIGIGSASALFAALFPHSRRIVVVENLASVALAQRGKRESPKNAKRFDWQLPYHQRIEVDLLRTFDCLLCGSDLVRVLQQNGWSADSRLIAVEAASPGAWQKALKEALEGDRSPGRAKRC